MPHGFVRRNVSELRSEPVVSAYAGAVLAAQGIVAVYWYSSGRLSVLSTGEPLCWPHFEQCWTLRPISVDLVAVLTISHFAALAGATAALILRRWTAFWGALCLINVYVFSLMSLDYRFRSNELYMLFWLNGSYLLVPHKKWVVPVTIVSFYFWAGSLKLNAEWLSGAALYYELWLIPGVWVPVACAYVVVLEMGMIWGLLARRAWVTVTVLAQLGLFHLQSLSQIVWFYPALMAAILSWFVLDLVISRPRVAQVTRWLRFQAPVAAYGVAALFGACQMVPLLFRGDPTLTGQGRIFALHMFEARQVCQVDATVHYENRTEQVDLRLQGLPPRVACDPIVYFSRMHTLCRDGRSRPTFLDADWLMRVRRSTEVEYRTVADVRDFCRQNPTYALLGNNAWLK